MPEENPSIVQSVTATFAAVTRTAIPSGTVPRIVCPEQFNATPGVAIVRADAPQTRSASSLAERVRVAPHSTTGFALSVAAQSGPTLKTMSNPILAERIPFELLTCKTLQRLKARRAPS
jgi:hypothetical protein